MSSPSPQPPSRTSQVQALFVQHASAIRGFVLALVPNPHCADDVVQETFLTATAKAEAFEPGTNFRAWAFAIARNKAMQAVDRRSAPLMETLSPDLLDTLCADAADAFSEHDARLPLLEACIELLAPQARRAVALRYQHGDRPPEIARQMGWSVGAVKVALSRAKAFLRECVTSRISNRPFSA